MKYKIGGGVVLLCCIFISIIIANSSIGHTFHSFLSKSIAISFGEFTIDRSIHQWINEGLMSVFFFLIGLEIKRELTGGQFSDTKKALLPIGAAVGGMIFPALVFTYFNYGLPTINAWAIPVATDIAIVLCLLSFASKNVPTSVRVFIALLAIFDDLGSVLIIAIYYTETIYWFNLLIAGCFLGLMIFMNVMGVRRVVYYLIIGVGGFWLSFMLSGFHATIGGVIAAMVIPGWSKINKEEFLQSASSLIKQYDKTKELEGSYVSQKQEDLLEEMGHLSYEADTPLQKLEHDLKPLVSFLILPLFALSSAGIIITKSFWTDLMHPLGQGIVLGLFIGKFVGITLTSYVLLKYKLAIFPEGMTWKHLYGLAFLAGFGFTMSIFIAELAISDETLLNASKSAILAGSFLSALFGMLYFRYAKFNSKKDNLSH